ncbi:MAG TPA: extracellular solute-binding protein [Candidatus Saccharimonadales bacterium]|nr:extracellular solute-binding protein [Candidatus Saccharimonadales bacterium]
MKKQLRLAALVAGVAIIAAACSSGGASTAPSAATSAAPTAAASTGTESTAPESTAPESQAPAALAGELTLWHSYSSGAGTELDALNEVLDTVKAANPELVVNVLEVPFNDLFTKYDTDAATGGGPDLFIAPNDSMGRQARDGVIADLTAALEGKLTGKTETAVNGSKVGDALFMVPESLKAVGLFYDSAKIATPPATTDALLAGVTDGSIKAGFFGGNNGLYHNFGWWAGFGGQLMDETGKCIADQGGVADAYAYLVSLQTAGAKFYPNYDDMANDFKAGTIDLIVDGPWATGGYKTTVPGVASAPMPAGPSGPAQPFAGVDGWYINPASADLDLAVNFALAMTDETAEQVFVDKAGHIPANTANTITDPITQGFADAVATGFPRPQVPQLDNFWGNFGTAQQKILESGADPVAEVATACAAMNTANGL